MLNDDWKRTDMGFPTALASTASMPRSALAADWHERAYHARQPMSAMQVSEGWLEVVFDDSDDAI